MIFVILDVLWLGVRLTVTSSNSHRRPLLSVQLWRSARGFWCRFMRREQESGH